MPATKDHVLAIARAELGYRESGSNRTKYGAWYGMNGVAWCAIWVSWVADRANAEDIIPRHAYTPAGAAWFMKHGRYSRTPRRGDIAYFEFPGMHRISHVGIVEAVHRDGSVTTLEGNTNFAGSRTGGQVMRKRRPRSLVAGYGHPDYSTSAQMVAYRRKVAAAAKASMLAKARAAAAAKAKAAKARAAAALETKRRKAAAAAAAAALAAIAAGGTAVITNDPGVSPQPTPTTSAASVPSGSLTASPTPAPTTARPTPRPTVTKKPAVKPRPVLTRTLTYTKGRPLMVGGDVGRVQVLVGAKLDREYGPATKRHVATWQRKHHLKVDGEFGKASAIRAGWRWVPR